METLIHITLQIKGSKTIGTSSCLIIAGLLLQQIQVLQVYWISRILAMHHITPWNHSCPLHHNFISKVSLVTKYTCEYTKCHYRITFCCWYFWWRDSKIEKGKSFNNCIFSIDIFYVSILFESLSRWYFNKQSLIFNEFLNSTSPF